MRAQSDNHDRRFSAGSVQTGSAGHHAATLGRTLQGWIDWIAPTMQI